MFKYESFLRLLNQTSLAYKPGSIGEVLMDPGYFANVIRISPSLGLAVTCDGVGTKVLIAQEMKKFDTIGIDCIAMNVNDLLCVGAEPLTFLDYMALQYSDEQQKMDLAKGLLRGAFLSEISISGGETAIVKDLIQGKQMKGFDLAGFGIGIVDPDKLIDGREVRCGDLVVGLHSNGLHSNGYTLARKVFENAEISYHADVDIINAILGEALLTPTIIYTPVIKQIIAELRSSVHALINITGGGLLNLLRTRTRSSILIEDKFDNIQPIFNLIQQVGDLSDIEMFNNFNMGIGFCIIVPPEAYDKTTEICSHRGFPCSLIGKVVPSKFQLEIPAKNLVVKDSKFILG